jgi:hypothetical protein
MSSHIRSVLGVLLILVQQTFAADLTVKTVDKETPKELDGSFREVLLSKAVQVTDGEKPVYEFWFCRELPLSAKPESLKDHLDQLKPAMFLGAVMVHNEKRDYRDDELRSGLYTMRFSLQPQDGNHLGTAEFPYFAVLIPAKADTKIDGIKTYKEMTRASAKGTSSEHPRVMSLRPAASAEGELPLVNEPAEEHKSVRVKVPAKAPNDTALSNIIFEIVFQGAAKH